ncbi:helix-turn-helix transcriptional regulator [Bacillus sp. SM2101]|uniref:helix-turn-helix transcriptional regulator n=1 Tax=Bacillus sp. SM2101 TaxID=2805366 RepID=UPI001BDF6DAB|nr:helix-turn-helix transcriptional regulator [Bacillus sp. SM2101]
MKQQISVTRLAEMVQVHRGERTQENIANLTGINRQVIGRIESGKHIPSVPQLNILLEVLDINFSDILEEKEQSVFVAMMGEAKTEEEKEGFEKMISMMLCLRKYERLKGVFNG